MKKIAVNILFSGGTLRCAAKQTKLSKITVSRLRMALSQEDKSAIKSLLSPSKSKRRRSPHFANFEERQIVEFVKVAARRGFAVTPDEFRVIAGDIGEALGKPFKNGLPSIEWINLFRTRHLDLTVRRINRISIAKHDAQHPDHVRTYETVLRAVLVIRAV